MRWRRDAQHGQTSPQSYLNVCLLLLIAIYPFVHTSTDWSTEAAPHLSVSCLALPLAEKCTLLMEREWDNMKTWTDILCRWAFTSKYMTHSSPLLCFICLNIVVVNFSKHWLLCMCRLADYVSAIYVLQRYSVCVYVYRANGTENHPNCLARQAVAYFRFKIFFRCCSCIARVLLSCRWWHSAHHLLFMWHVGMVVLLLLKAFGISAIKLRALSLSPSPRLKGNAKRKIM